MTTNPATIIEISRSWTMKLEVILLILCLIVRKTICKLSVDMRNRTRRSRRCWREASSFWIKSIVMKLLVLSLLLNRSSSSLNLLSRIISSILNSLSSRYLHLWTWLFLNFLRISWKSIPWTHPAKTTSRISLPLLIFWQNAGNLLKILIRRKRLRNRSGRMLRFLKKMTRLWLLVIF